MLIRKLDEVKTVEWGNGTEPPVPARGGRHGLHGDRHDRPAGTKSRLEYKNHLEACYCIEGSGSVIEMDGTEHEIVVGTMYALDKHDAHYLLASPERGPAARLHVHAGAARATRPTTSPSPESTLRLRRMDRMDRRAEGAAEVARRVLRAAQRGSHRGRREQRLPAREVGADPRDRRASACPFDPEWGGLGHDALTIIYVLEHLGYGCRDSGLLFSVATQIVSMAIPIQKFGSDDLKERYLRRLIDGSIISAHAISEPDAGSDATAMTTTATEDGDSYVLNGKKAFCTSGPVADVITVYAKTEAEGGATGITAFLVETDTPGITVGEPIPKMGLNTSPIGELEFTDCRVPKENLIGKPGGGFFILEHVMTWEILCIFIMMVGEMQHRLEQCIDFAKTAQAVRRADRVEPVHRRQDRRHEDRRRDLAASTSTTPPSGSPASAASSTEIAMCQAGDQRGEPRLGAVGGADLRRHAATCARPAWRRTCAPPSGRRSTRAPTRCSASGSRRCSA